METTYLVANNLIARVSRMFLLHRTNSCLMGFGGLAASRDLWRGTLTGREVADQKSVMRFLLTISLSALPRSSLEEDRPKLSSEKLRLLLKFWSFIGAVWFSDISV